MNVLMAMAIMICGLSAAVNSAFGQTWTLTSAPTNYWNSIASSANGKNLAVVGGTGCYTSTNSGITWKSNSLPVSQSLQVIASSADGTKLAGAGGNHGGIDESTNGGLNWTGIDPGDVSLPSVVCSADGRIVVITMSGGTILVSTNTGATRYSENVLPSGLAFAAMSANGSCLAFAISSGKLICTTNFGTTWVTNNLSQNWRGIAASIDGKKLVAAPYGGNLYTSTDFGFTWVQQTNSPNLLWWSVASSADGARLVAVSGRAGGPGLIYTSNDSGNTWVSNNAPNLGWTSVVSSSDGNKLYAAAYNSGIWTLQTPPTPQLNLTASNTNLALSWLIPSTNFVVQQSPNLTSWSSVTDTPVLNLTNLNNELSVSPTNSSGFFRLISQ